MASACTIAPVYQGTMENFTDRTDPALLQAIAESRNQEAFSQLFSRYHQAAYSVAYFITGNRQLAEDAVQEAMLSVWKYAGNFRTGNEARPWILQIVARRSIRISMKKRGSELPMQEEHLSGSPQDSACPADLAEQAELVAFLRQALDRLPTLDRQLVALYYGAGLTQYEIADELSMPRATVTVRLRKVLDRLRGQLTATGCAAILPLLSQDGLSQAICSGRVMRPGLRDEVLDQLSHAEPDSSEAISRRAIPAKPVPSAYLWSGVVVILVSAGAIWWSTSGKPEAESIRKEAVPVAPALVKEEAEVTFQPLASSGPAWPATGSWNFEIAPPPPEMLLAGFWTWGYSQQIKKRFIAPKIFMQDGKPKAFPGFLKLPILPAHSPLCITAEVKGMGETKLSIMALWGNESSVLPTVIEFGLIPGPTTIDIKSTYGLRFYIWGKWIATILEGKVVSVLEYPQAYPGTALFLRVNKIALLSLSAAFVQLSELPFEVEPMLKSIEEIRKKSGEIILKFEEETLDLKPFN